MNLSKNEDYKKDNYNNVNNQQNNNIDLNKKILNKVEELSDKIQGTTIAEYVEMIRSPRRMIVINFIAGLARGFGIAIGATILGAVFLFILFRLAQLNLPIIGRFIAEIVVIVNSFL